jgi:hypothetical protein
MITLILTALAFLVIGFVVGIGFYHNNETKIKKVEQDSKDFTKHLID